MKRGRGEDKVVGPLFPRLHANDADGGRLRAPQRNKMALYELFSIPSQKSSSDAGGALPKQLHVDRSSVAASFLGQTCRLERSVCSPFCAPHTPAHMQEKVDPHSVGGVDQNIKSTCQERSFSKQRGFHRMATSAANGQMGVNCSSLYPDDLSIVKCPFEKKSGEEDFKVPTCVQPGNVLHSNKDHHSTGREGTTHSHLHSPQRSGATTHSQSQVQSSYTLHLRRDGSYNLLPQQCENSDKGKGKRTVGLQKDMEDSLSPSMREKVADQLKIHRTSSNEERPTFIQNELNTLQGGSVRLSQESHGSLSQARSLSDGQFKEKQVISNERTESCSKISSDKSLLEPYVTECDKIAGKMVREAESVDRTGSPDDAGNIDPLGNSNKNHSREDASGNDVASETSMANSILGVGICPSDVVGLIGPKHFWKARRAITNQQRVFAMQVFELHRLIKVQKLIAVSPNLLLDNPFYCHSSPNSQLKDPSPSFLPKRHLQIKQKDGGPHKVNESECATENTVSADLLVNPQVKIVQQKDGSNKAIQGGECATEGTGGSLPLPDEHDKGPICQLPREATGRAPSFPAFPATSDNSSGAWCFHPSGSQWLVPVMSPSEGLIYKLYTGPHPPNAAFMAPVYTGCGPLSLAPGAGDLMKPAFGAPMHHQQPTMGVFPGAVTPNFFPAQYGESHISSSPIEKMRSMTLPQPNGQPEQHSWSSCNTSNRRGEAALENAQKVHISEENDIQASTASCTADRSRKEEDVQPQFPLVASMECSGGPLQVRLIKVVPHNPKCATESAARIFLSIQKERQQHDSV